MPAAPRQVSPDAFFRLLMTLSAYIHDAFCLYPYSFYVQYTTRITHQIRYNARLFTQRKL